MADIISFNGKVRKIKAQQHKERTAVNQSIQGDSGMGGFMAEVEKDTTNLSTAIGKSREDAIQMASDFYKKYPMLIEYVRSPEYMLRGK